MFKPRVFVGLDLGTYGSGVSYFFKGNGEGDPAQKIPTLLTSWPGQPVASPKSLSALLIDSDRKVAAWGYDARRRALTQVPGENAPRYYSSFKMGLMEELVCLVDGEGPGQGGESTDDQDEEELATGPEDVGEHDEDGAVEWESPTDTAPGLEPRPRPPDLREMSVRKRSEALIEAYLRCLYTAALEEIRAAGYSEHDIRWCVTVPAIWTDEQKQTTRDLAIRAGMPAEDGRLILALEPEAAAHYARASGVNVAGSEGEEDTDLTAPGCRFIVVDCGGGTADLTGYENDEEGRMVESGLPSGGPHGSDVINHAFRDRLLVDRFGNPEIVQHLAEQSPEAMLELSEAWERAKLDFGPDEKDPICINLPAAIHRRLGTQVRKRLARKQAGESYALIVTPAETAELFDTVVPDILDLIDAQLKECENTSQPGSAQPLVLLVGGFAASRYLQHAVKQRVEGHARVLVPPEPGAAVLFGAAYYAYDPQTRARRSRLTYGAGISSRFEEGVDPEETRWTSSDGIDRCRTRFSKLVTRGDLIDTGIEARESYLPIEPTSRRMTIDLYSSTEPDPRYYTDPGCKQVGFIKVDLSKAMAFALEDRGVDLYLSFGETQIKARAVVKRSGEEVSTTISFTSDY
ncbi:Hsp70 family protein [Streptomyces sp. NPDC059989]|uniref:Hsp70 family protein n=1 Tax=Streptomyces sp. NPDC059989 TaxID=3347026 RepID=UPI003673A161